MRLGPNLSVRVVAILLAGFVALQLLIVVATRLPTHGSDERPYGLPEPREIGAMVAAIEQTPADRRAALVDLFDEGLYSVRIEAGGVQPSPHETTDDLVQLGRYYARALPGHAVAVDARRAWLGALLTSDTRPTRIFSPVSLAISLDDGTALVLTSRPSDNIQAFLGRRSLLGAFAGLLLLVILMLAMRQTMRPITRLARAVRAYGGRSDEPPLPVEGASEVRDLARAFNDMKGRISGLMAERTRTLAAIAHDLRTYLTRLRLRAEYIEDADHRERAVRDLDEMAMLLDDTLLLAQGDAGAGDPAAPVDLSALVRDGVEIREPGSALILDLPDVPVTVRARPLAVRRILANLIDNGERHAAHVEVALISRAGQALLTVCDDGPGIAPEMLVRLGEPFVRADPSRNRESGGAGLGLAIVKALAARDGATVQFENRPGGGLRVTVAWPLA